MGSTLQDRPITSSPFEQPTARPRGRRLAVGLGAAALVASLAVVGGERALGLLPSWGSPLQEQVIDRQRPALMLALSDLSDYHAAQGTYQVVVDLERDTRFVPSVVKGERTTYLATGTVDGLVDLRGLGPGAVRVEGQSVTIDLPEPRLGDAALDLEQSRVLSRDRGVIDRVSGALSDSPTSERDVALLAEDKIVDAAASSDLLARTRESARSMLTDLVRSLGYSDVTVRFTSDART